MLPKLARKQQTLLAWWHGADRGTEITAITRTLHPSTLHPSTHPAARLPPFTPAGILLMLLFASLAMWTVYLMVVLYLDNKSRKIKEGTW